MKGIGEQMTKTDNRSTGNRFEAEMSHILAECGFWVHVMQQNKAGQPADLIAVLGKFHTLIDCKVCDKGSFSFDRVEENQRTAMRMFTRRGMELCYFALKLPDDTIRMISLSRIETLESRGKKRLSEKDIEHETWLLDDWLNSADVWGKDT